MGMIELQGRYQVTTSPTRDQGPSQHMSRTGSKETSDNFDRHHLVQLLHLHYDDQVQGIICCIAPSKHTLALHCMQEPNHGYVRAPQRLWCHKAGV
jgi:hypothetical protein